MDLCFRFDPCMLPLFGSGRYTGREHESMAALLGSGAGGEGSGGLVEPIDAEALMRVMRRQMGR